MKSVEVSAEQEVPRNESDLPSYNHQTNHGHSDFDNRLFDLLRLLNNGISNTSNLGMLRSSDLSESSTISSSGHIIVPLSPEPIRNAATQGLSVLPPRRFYRTFWRAMARKVLTSAENASTLHLMEAYW